MLLDTHLGNLRSLPSAPSGVDTVTLDWHQCHLRAIRAQTDRGEPAGILLPLGVGVTDGDLLQSSATGHQVLIRVRPAAVLITAPLSPETAAHLALELGNLHLPTQILGSQILLPADESSRSLLTRLAIPFTEENRFFAPERVSVLQMVNISPEVKITRRG